MFAIANCITGPADLASWIEDEYRVVLGTLDNVSGFHDFYLRKLTGFDSESTFVSLTTWDDMDSFRNWRQSSDFMSAHRARVDRSKFSRLRTPRRYDYPLAAGPVDLAELDALVLASLSDSGHLPAASAATLEPVLTHIRA
ncbi:antibiotic biosynthesis monooxygenase family protein [Nocardia tengchongensis]|uniref:antibiotic biosynthesis monooxygenase family protein n=1 Tax=Nocardia tengchongensis TaxID=2055889 RepID=UPI0036849EB7